MKNTNEPTNMFPNVEMVNLANLTGKATRKGLEQAIIVEGRIVNVVSDGYGLLKNENFFLRVEENLINADIEFTKREINRDNRSFSTDYILSSKDYVIDIKQAGLTKYPDKLNPMLRFTTSYDGSCQSSGHLAIYRQVCTNGLHALSNTEIGFKVKHRGNITEVVMPQLDSIVTSFTSNEYYELRRKFEVLAEKPITDLRGFVKFVADKTKLFKYEASEKNTEPSLNARTIIETVQRESEQLGTVPNLWLGYNAFNELLHDKLKKTFDQQRKIDVSLFDTVLSMS